MRRVRSYSAGSNDDPYVPPIKDHAEGVEKEGGRYLWRRRLRRKIFSPRNWEGEGIAEKNSGEEEKPFGDYVLNPEKNNGEIGKSSPAAAALETLDKIRKSK